MLERYTELRSKLNHDEAVLAQMQDYLTFKHLGTTVATVEMSLAGSGEAQPILQLSGVHIDPATALSLAAWIQDRFAPGREGVP
jgi:hypothetical protein